MDIKEKIPTFPVVIIIGVVRITLVIGMTEYNIIQYFSALAYPNTL